MKLFTYILIIGTLIGSLTLGEATTPFWGQASWQTLAQQMISVSTNVYYEVGPGQTYATVQAALNATPFTFDGGQVTGTVPDPFTQNHVIRVHAGTYAGFNTDYFSKLNGKASRTSTACRLIIQAVPGDLVTVNTTSTSYIRESYVTIQGLKFTGSTGVNSYYLTLNYYNEGRGGLLIYNNEFVGASPFWFRNPNSEAVQFSYAFVHNYVHNFDASYVVNAGISDTGKAMMAGNLIAFPSAAGGAMGIAMLTPAGAGTRHVLNNTYYTGSAVATGKAFVYTTGVNQSIVTIANNLLVQDTDGTERDIGFNIYSGGGAGVYVTHFPVFRNNLQYDNGITNHRWARITENGGVQAGDALSTLVAFNNYTNAVDATPGEENSLDNTNPLLVNPAGYNFRLQATSPALNAGDASRWTTAVNDLEIAALLASYYNAALDPGFDLGHANIGAMKQQ
ncbi:MAG: hypothetical protein ACYDBB_09720 [Armatimonadota bacterium]